MRDESSKGILSFYSPPKPWALLPIRLVDTARDVNEMQRGIRLASHLQCVPPKSPAPLSLSCSLGCLWCCVSVYPFTDLLLTLFPSHPPSLCLILHLPPRYSLALTLHPSPLLGWAHSSYLLRRPTFQRCRGSLPASLVTAIPWVPTILGSLLI